MTSEPADSAIAARVIDGDQAAFAQLVHRHARAAKRAAVLAGAGPDADDAVQEAFVKAYKSLAGFHGDAFRPWLLRIVVNETYNLHRGRSRRTAREQRWALPDLWVDDAGAAVDPELLVLTATRRDQLLDHVRALSADLRAVVACRYLLELSEQETAAVLQVPPGTVKSRLHRALATLRQAVSDDA